MPHFDRNSQIQYIGSQSAPPFGGTGEKGGAAITTVDYSDLHIGLELAWIHFFVVSAGNCISR